MDDDVRWFRALLDRKGVPVRRGSALDRDLAAVEWVAPRLRHELPVEDEQTFLGLLRSALGIIQLVSAIRQSLSVTEASLDEIWSMFRGADVSLTRRATGSKERNTCWEVFIAAIAATIAEDVTLEEPDVLFTWRGVRWGVACKVLYSENSDKHVAEIVDGAKQIEKSAADFGIVAVNVTNLLPHERYRQQAPVDPDALIPLFAHDVQLVAAPLHREDLFRRLRQDKSGAPRNKTRALMLYGQAGLTTNAGARAMSSAMWPDGWRVIEVGERNLIAAWNQAVHAAFPGPDLEP